MKTIRNLLLSVMVATVLILQTGCFGSFPLTMKVYEFNKGVGDKFVQEVVFLAMLIIPVYEVVSFVDIIVLNSIEFWTGEDPLSMNEGEEDVQVVQSGDKVYEITATKNKFKIKQLEGADKGEEINMVFTPNNRSWNLKKGNKLHKLVSYTDDVINVHYPNRTVTYDREEDLATIKEDISCCYNGLACQ